MTGHWEMMGIETKKPFITFTEHGFPPELIAELEKKMRQKNYRKPVGKRNKDFRGTRRAGNQGRKADRVHTSADSVLQICGNEETMGLETLYHYCEIARGTDDA